MDWRKLLALRERFLPAQGADSGFGVDRMVRNDEADPHWSHVQIASAECATVGITPDTPVIIFCFKGARASNTFVALEEAGIRNVGIYFGSWNEWSRDPSLPIEEGLPYPISRLAA
jgi:thiosulfate/3-mercaptopyruvate sulfurtransferase